MHKCIHQPSHIAALCGTPRKDLQKLFAEKKWWRPEYPVCTGRSVRPETFRRVSPSVTTYGIRIGYSPETSRILCLPPHWTGVSGQHPPEYPAQPETPVCASRRLRVQQVATALFPGPLYIATLLPPWVAATSTLTPPLLPTFKLIDLPP